MFVAAANVPTSLQRSLMPRSTLDQALITGTSMALGYAITEVVHDPLEVVVQRLVASNTRATEDARRRVTAAVDCVGMLVGFALQSGFKRRPGEHLQRGALRTGGYFLSLAGGSGATVAAIDGVLHALDEHTGCRLRSLPLALPVGAAFTGVSDFLLRRRHREEDAALFAGEEWRLSPWRSIVLGCAVGAALGAIAGAERGFAGALGRVLEKGVPGGGRIGRLGGHALALAGVAGGIELALARMFARMETMAGQIEPGYELPPHSPCVSGGPGSRVRFESLGTQGRRHVSTHLRPEEIELVMGEPARAHPIRIFVGLDSAPTDRERVALVVEEIVRTGALERSLLVLISPTGSGYVNPAAVEAVEYFTRGDSATVTIQYSKRPSAFSLGSVDDGRQQNRLLFEAVHSLLRQRPPEERPRVVLFGESLGAHTSQDAFIHEGTQGLLRLDIERALWIGTPYASEWKQEVLRNDGPLIDRSLVGRVNNHHELEELMCSSGTSPRYVMLTHHNDAVAYFGLDLLLACPDWLGDPATRPRGVPRSERYSPINTFLQTLVDMKNSSRVVAGRFDARGHDYRADVARFARTVYGLDATERQVERVEESLRGRELARVRQPQRSAG
jgi:uncharacterized membrane protein